MILNRTMMYFFLLITLLSVAVVWLNQHNLTVSSLAPTIVMSEQTELRPELYELVPTCATQECVATNMTHLKLKSP